MSINSMLLPQLPAPSVQILSTCSFTPDEFRKWGVGHEVHADGAFGICGAAFDVSLGTAFESA
jgi:hypothetical protein